MISAPIDGRATASACYPWADHIPFQALLGVDAHMARFAAAAAASAAAVYVLTAPEIVSAAAALPPASEFADGQQRHVHVRFGTPREPRLLHAAYNAVFFTDDGHQPGPTRSGHHPFGRGDVTPKGADSLVVVGKARWTPHRIDGSHPPRLATPADFLDVDDAPTCAEPAGPLLCQACGDFDPAAWMRRATPPSAGAQTLERLAAERPIVLLPWNLSHPGSLAPGVIGAAVQLAASSRFAPLLAVMPYNDSPAGLPKLEAVARLWRPAETADRPTVVFLRAAARDGGAALARLCQRAWIDPTDPEWRWTARRLRRLGLPVNFLSDVPPEHIDEHEQGELGPDQWVDVADQSYGPLVWRSRCLSPRRLAALAAAVVLGVDRPLPAIAATTGAAGFDVMAPIWAAARAFDHG